MTEQRDGDRAAANRAAADPGACIEAFVHVRDCEIAYSRRGRGAPVLLMASDARLRQRLSVGLAARFKVIAPALGAQWHGIPSGILMRELIDGLGLVRPHLVVDGGLGIAALRFVIVDPDSVKRLAIVWSDEGVRCKHDELIEDRLLFADRSLLLVRSDGANPDDDAELAAISGFLSEDSSRA